MNIPAAYNRIARIMNQPPDPSRKHGELHVHAFVFFTANYGANDFIFARFRRSGKLKFLLARLEQEVPSFDMASILGSEQGEAVDRAIAVPGFASTCGHAQEQLLAGLDGDLRSALSGDLVATVAVGGDLDNVRLVRCLRLPEQRSQDRDRDKHRTNFGPSCHDV